MAEVILVAGCHFGVGGSCEWDLEGGHKVDKALDGSCGWWRRLGMDSF